MFGSSPVKYLFLLLLTPMMGKGQSIGDRDYIFTSLEQAIANKEWVFQLDLSKQKRRDFPLEVLQFPNLEYLNLSKNKIDLVPIEIGELKRLRVLDLSKNDITRIPLQIGDCLQLEKLLLAKNNIETLPASIGKLERLSWLDLWYNNILSLPREMENLQLEYLDLRGMSLSDELEEKLKTWLPDTHIQFSQACDCKY